MLSCRIILILAIILKDTGLNKAVEVKLENQSTVSPNINAGGTFEVHCTFSGKELNSDVTIHRITKDDNETIVKSYYITNSNCKRYKTKLEVKDGGNVYLSLTVKDAKVEDSGTYYCAWKKYESNKKEYVVKGGSLTSVEIIEKSENKNSSTIYRSVENIKVNETDIGISVGCMVKSSGTLKSPDINIFSNDEDVTKFFFVDNKTEVSYASNCGNLFKISITMLRQVTSTFNRFNGKKLKCTAKLLDQTMDKSADVRVIFKPILTCETKRTNINSSDTAVFTCKAEGNPKPKLVWLAGNMGFEETLENSDKKDNLKSETIASTDYSVQSTLYVKVTPTSWSKIFRAKATSSIGNAERRLHIPQAGTAAGRGQTLKPNIMYSISIGLTLLLIFCSAK